MFSEAKGWCRDGGTGTGAQGSAHLAHGAAMGEARRGEAHNLPSRLVADHIEVVFQRRVLRALEVHQLRFLVDPDLWGHRAPGEVALGSLCLPPHGRQLSACHTGRAQCSADRGPLLPRAGWRSVWGRRTAQTPILLGQPHALGQHETRTLDSSCGRTGAEVPVPWTVPSWAEAQQPQGQPTPLTQRSAVKRWRSLPPDPMWF